MTKEEFKNLPDGLYANIETTKGDMLVEFHEKEAPMTVANFIGLAEGKIKNDAKPLGTPFYNGIVFHRVIQNFMIQTGDPKGTGAGGPGYSFPDEPHEDLKHDGKGILSMANSGPNTNGSQFFITEVPTPWLDGKHTVFGKVIRGIDVIDSIAAVEKNVQDRPLQEISIQRIETLRKGNEYQKYDPAQAFETAKKQHTAKMEEKARKEKEAMAAEVNRIKDLAAKAETRESGLKYHIIEKGSGNKPAAGDDIQVHYTLRLADGKVVDSSYQRNSPLDITIGETQLISGWMEALTMFERGSKVLLIIPPELGYGARGAGGVIPPNATLYFDMEVLD
ncbi:MAG: peptidylprolyl isomerase [Weeksellaceae bacterium]|nr:peptidylprolyl isomerase [Weeksellaceae bacterium]